MPWYFYNGRVTVPVKTPNGTVVTVPPRGYIEASPQAVKKYGAKMRRCAPPREAVEALASIPETTIAAPQKKSPLAGSIKERFKNTPDDVKPKTEKPKVAEAKAPKRRTRTPTPK